MCTRFATVMGMESVRIRTIAAVVFAAALAGAVILKILFDASAHGELIDPGLATLAGAVIGFGALAWTSYYNARAERIRQEKHRNEERRALAGALAAEMSNNFTQLLAMCETAKDIMKATSTDRVGEGSSKAFEAYSPTVSFTIYEGNSGQIGSLGPFWTYLTASAYQDFHKVYLNLKKASLQGGLIDELIEDLKKAYDVGNLLFLFSDGGDEELLLHQYIQHRGYPSQ